MREASNVSPFAKLDSRAQKEQWICMQCQNTKPTPVAERSVQLAGIRLPETTDADYGLEKTKPTEVQHKQTKVGILQPAHHSQYNAVVKRLQQAQRQAGAYSSWSS